MFNHYICCKGTRKCYIEQFNSLLSFVQNKDISWSEFFILQRSETYIGKRFFAIMPFCSCYLIDLS